MNRWTQDVRWTQDIRSRFALRKPVGRSQQYFSAIGIIADIVSLDEREVMIRSLRVFLLAGCGIVAMLAAAKPPQHTAMAGDRANVSKATITGLVRDIACPIQNLDSNATHLSMKCVLAYGEGRFTARYSDQRW